MKRKTRRIILTVAIVVFLMLTYVAVFYAQGYKYSFEDGEFLRTGAIYIKANNDAEVYFDDELVGTTSFLGDSFSKSRLLPGDYKVTVTRDGYSIWEKQVSVEEGFLTEFPKIMILSENEDERSELVKEIELLLYPLISPTPTPSASNRPLPSRKPTPSPSPTPITDPFYIEDNKLFRNSTNPDVIADNVMGFALSRNDNKLAWWNSNNEVWVIWLNDTNYQPYHKNGDMELIIRFSTAIKNIGWFRDEDHIVVDSIGYKIIEIDTRSDVNVIRI